MKKEARLLGIDDGPFVRGKDKNALIVGAFFRGGSFLDGVMSTRVKLDGDDATNKISEMINKSKFKVQIQCILINGIAVGGFNIIDIHLLRKKTGIPVMAVSRKKSDAKKLISALEKLKKSKQIKMIKSAGEMIKISHLFVQTSGLSASEAGEILKIGIRNSKVPEALRVAHLMAGGVITGESKGKS